MSPIAQDTTSNKVQANHYDELGIQCYLQIKITINSIFNYIA